MRRGLLTNYCGINLAVRSIIMRCLVAGRAAEMRLKSSLLMTLILLFLMTLSSPVSGMVNMTEARERLTNSWWSSEFQTQALEPEERYFFEQVTVA